MVNTHQRFAASEEIHRRAQDARGSMVWSSVKGNDYLARSYYDKQGVRRQKSLGPRSPETELIKAEFEHSREEVKKRLADIEAALSRQAAVNRALGLARVPLAAARILRSLKKAGLLGGGVRVVGTNALYAYEAAAGALVDPGITATADIDLLFDSRHHINFVISDDVPERSLLRVLRQFDASFERSEQTYRARNAEGYLVDLIKPMRNPPWKQDVASIDPAGGDDLVAAEIAGLVWLENAPAFESVVIDERGAPLRMVAPDPRVWAAHKLWLSQRADRQPIKKRRDEEQAATTAALVKTYLPHLPYDANELKMLPRDVFDAAAPLFA